MSKQANQKTDDTLRVKVGKLPQKEKKLGGREAENVKGGGGAGGGVVGHPSRQIGEEIPS